MAETVPSKRQRPSASEDHDAEDKKRGRPRVDKKDESAADRRRTQIRMAQRAYRQRKETTLDDLRKRVAELNNTIELMNKAFTDCRDRLCVLGVSDDQWRSLQETSKQYEGWIKAARSSDPGSGDESSARDADPSPTSSEERRKRRKEMLEPRNVPAWMDQSLVDRARKLDRTSAQVDMGPWGYAMADWEPTGALTPLQPSAQDVPSQALVASRPASPQIPDDHYPAYPTSLPKEMTAPVTYSFQESTFARRLHRASLERGYQVLLDPSRVPGAYDKAFSFCLSGKKMTRQMLIKGFKMLLDRGPHEELIYLEARYRIGGAGTHYPHRDQFGNLVPKKDFPNAGFISPGAVGLLEEKKRKYREPKDLTEVPKGYEGEWLDPYDVEGYLAEKGIYLDPMASFAEIEVADPASDASSSSSSSSSVAPPKTPEDLMLPLEQEVARPSAKPTQGRNDFDWLNPSPGDLSAMITDVGFSDAETGSWLNFLNPDGSQVPDLTWDAAQADEFLRVSAMMDQFSSMHNVVDGAPSQPRKKVVTIDIQKFVKALINSGVCIGRSPGYRRHEVDRALAYASFDAF